MTAHPQLLPPNVVPHWYAGGPALAAWRGIPPVGEASPEEWIGATVARFGEPDRGPARLSDGALLRDVIARDPVGWLGRDDGAPGDTGVLVKLLDAGQRLPVHVHPNRDFACKHLGCPYGKTEAWYVLRAGADATVWVGWREEVDPERLSAMVEAQDTEGMLASMHRIRVRPGDGVLVPGGTPHAVGPGILLVEAQEPTDQSILLERVNTTASDDEVFLGLDRELALSAVETSALDDVDDLRRHIGDDTDGLRSVLPDAAADYFRMDVLTRAGEVPAGFAVAVVLDGTGTVRSEAGSLAVSAGDTAVVPSAAGDWHVSGDVRVLVCRPGESWPPPQPTSEREGAA
jgi:mannose-6-phosphate isomerase